MSLDVFYLNVGSDQYAACLSLHPKLDGPPKAQMTNMQSGPPELLSGVICRPLFRRVAEAEIRWIIFMAYLSTAVVVLCVTPPHELLTPLAESRATPASALSQQKTKKYTICRCVALFVKCL